MLAAVCVCARAVQGARGAAKNAQCASAPLHNALLLLSRTLIAPSLQHNSATTPGGASAAWMLAAAYP